MHNVKTLVNHHTSRPYNIAVRVIDDVHYHTDKTKLETTILVMQLYNAYVVSNGRAVKQCLLAALDIEH
jgi:hypothetical protein